MPRTVFRSDAPDVNAYQLLTAVVVPRPIAWVSTLSSDGVVNLAPHSFYTVACANPPIVQFTSVGAKDTLRNALATGEFVVNLANAALLHEVNDSSASFDADASEPHHLDIAMEPSEVVGPPRVRDSPVSIECTLHSTHELGDATVPSTIVESHSTHELGDSTIVLGTVALVTVADEVLVDGHPEYRRLAPLARLGKDEWARDAEVFSITRPRTPADIELR